MPVKDYANRSPRRRKTKRNHPLLLPLIIVILTGAISLTVYIVKQETAPPSQEQLLSKSEIPVPTSITETKKENEQETKETKKAKKEGDAKKIALPAEASTQTQFDFYTLLPQMEVSIPQAEPLSLSTDHQHYLLQVAAVRNLKDAIRLRDKLQGMNLMATVQTYHSTTGTRWNRVVTGPYTNLKAAEDAQDILFNHRIDSLLLRIKKQPPQ